MCVSSDIAIWLVNWHSLKMILKALRIAEGLVCGLEAFQISLWTRQTGSDVSDSRKHLFLVESRIFLTFKPFRYCFRFRDCMQVKRKLTNSLTLTKVQLFLCNGSFFFCERMHKTCYLRILF